MQEWEAAGADASSKKARERWHSMSWGRSTQDGQVYRLELWYEGPLGPWGWRGWSTLKNRNAKVSIWILRWKCPLHLPLNTFSTEGDGDVFLLWVGQRRAWDSRRGRTAHSQPEAAGGPHKSYALKRLRGNLGSGMWTALGYGIWRFEPIFSWVSTGQENFLLTLGYRIFSRDLQYSTL